MTNLVTPLSKSDTKQSHIKLPIRQSKCSVSKAMDSSKANIATSLFVPNSDLQQAFNRLPVLKPMDAASGTVSGNDSDTISQILKTPSGGSIAVLPKGEPDSEVPFTKSSHKFKKRSITPSVQHTKDKNAGHSDLSTAPMGQRRAIQVVPVVPVIDDIVSLPDSEYREAVDHLILKTMSQLPPLSKEDSDPVDNSIVEDQITQGIRHCVHTDPTSKTCQKDSVCDFTFSDLFAGTSSFSEHSVPRGAKPVSFVEWEDTDRVILQQHSKEAKIFGDFYRREWSQHDLFSEVVVAWPMCRHLSKLMQASVRCTWIQWRLK